MTHLSNANMHIKKRLSIGFVTMLFFTIAMVTIPASTATVPAQSIWIDPTYPDPSVTNLTIGETFSVDVMINVTSPTSAQGTGMFGFEYKFFWNSTYVNVTSYTTHIPSGWSPPNGFLVKDSIDVWTTGNKSGLFYHWYSYTALTASPFTGNMSLCTYNFNVTDQPTSPDPDFNGTLDLADVKIVDDKAQVFITDTTVPPKGTIQDGMYSVSAPIPPVKPLANFTWSPETPEVNEMVTFNGSLSTPNGGSIVSYAWNFSDGTSIVTEPDPITDHTYTAAGDYNVTLTVTDDEGLNNSTAKSITVQVGTPPNITDVSQIPLENNVLPEDEVKVNATVTDDLSGVKQVTLNYTNGDGTWITVDMTNLEGNIWNATIPAFPYCTNVTYVIIAEDNAKNTITTEEIGYEYQYHVIPEFPSFIILPLFMIVALAAVILGKMRARARSLPHHLNHSPQ